MKIEKTRPEITAADELRRQAEERLSGMPAEPQPTRTRESRRRLDHELKVRQIELDMQNMELRHVRDELETLLEKYTDLYDFAPVGYLTLDVKGTILTANLASADLLGVERVRLPGRRFGQFVTEEDRLSFAAFIGKVCASKAKESCEVRLSTEGNKSALILQINAVATESGQECSVVAIDITERKHAEDRRERLLLKLEAVLESINEGVVISDLEGNALTMNQEALALHEFEQDTQVRWPLSKLLDSYELIDLSGRTVPFEQWPVSRAIRGERFTDYEVRVRNKKTGKLWLASYNGTPVRNKSSDNILAVITVRDISDRKVVEEEIKRLNLSLAARTVDLEYAIQELEAFNYTVAHDLRNPLNVISIYCQALQEMCGSKLDAQCQRYIQETYDGTMRMNRLIDALLKFSQLSHARLNRKSVDLSTMARDVAEELKGTEATRRVTFLIEDGIVADGDANLLRVVLTNLLGNAWKFTGMRNEAIIEFGVMQTDGQQTFFVRDNGAGFDNATAEKIFAPFQRLPGAEAYRGFGIGLATVERIIRRHGGRVYAEGEPGKGATIYFTLSATGGFT